MSKEATLTSKFSIRLGIIDATDDGLGHVTNPFDPILVLYRSVADKLPNRNLLQ